MRLRQLPLRSLGVLSLGVGDAKQEASELAGTEHAMLDRPVLQPLLLQVLAKPGKHLVHEDFERCLQGSSPPIAE